MRGLLPIVAALVLWCPSALSQAQFTRVLPQCQFRHAQTPWSDGEVRRVWRAMVQMEAPTPVASLLAPMIRREAARFGVDPLVMVSIARQESHFRLDARGSKGEVGVFQIRPTLWAEELGLDPGALAEPAHNTRACAYILSRYLARYGTYRKAVRAYNHLRYGGRYARKVLSRYRRVAAAL
ncbi:MAG: hypothetical protein Kow0092_23910 [Deferrisomatales bacterium]